MMPKSWHGNCKYRFELIIFGGFLGLNMIVSMARESSADFIFCIRLGIAQIKIDFYLALRSTCSNFVLKINLYTLKINTNT